MNLSFLFLLLLSTTYLLRSEATPDLSVPDTNRFTVYFFLGEECIISQQYTLLIRRLHREYSNETIQFMGLFPNPSSTENKIRLFGKLYHLPFELRQDALQREMDRFGVKVTPEVIVYDQLKKETVYQGRIDNTFFRVGKRRTITTTSELEDVLKAIKNKEKVQPAKTEAVGCYITPLDASLKNVPMCKTVDDGR